ncbi:sensor domain-containing diguanylate cyclase [Bacillus sp. FJAT-22090]|uniref:sensor domain-containing diguanylate cyclase n=1 Tax=Bacillus sp. FJAT-22090 TaxID=1581038 RepID=UPI0011A07183|nr:sensor domain-containing diguanylate cyclase [Bacillus sp. FJAT-22090]
MKKTLRFWILTLITFSMIAILTCSLFSSYIVTKKSLIEKSLEQNEVYSLKLSKMTEEVFKALQANLEARKLDVVEHIGNPIELTKILDQLLVSGKNFNSLSIIGDDGVAIATSPNVGIIGNKIDSPGVREGLSKKENFISKPYKAITGRLIILISTPLFDESNTYLGMLNGTIYLEEDNFIQNILAEHFSEDGSYVFVVDKEGTLIYHPDEHRIGENVSENKVVKSLIKQKSGFQEVFNTKREHFLAGYSYISASEWGVVSQTPYKSSLAPLNGIMLKMFFYTLPFVLLFFGLAFLLSEKLASPLKNLALFTLHSSCDDNKREKPIISTWYFEAKQLTETIDNYRKKSEETVADFKHQSLTDPLTSLRNRRYSEFIFSDLLEHRKSFSMIMLDIDHFKTVNDEFGHNAGDQVLKFLADKMLAIAKETGICIRLGGEEFIIILPNYPLQDAYLLAEKLRNEVEKNIPPTNRKITISTGVGEYKTGKESISDFMHRVDKALYKAKAEGRNKTLISN